jgi:hypothetical protein
LWTICLGWLWTVILLISASRVARIKGMSHWSLLLHYSIHHNATSLFCWSWQGDFEIYKEMWRT